MRIAGNVLALPLGLGLVAACAFAAEPVGFFFESNQPFFQAQVEVTPLNETPPNFVVRGIVIPLSTGHTVVFDQELLRVAGLWSVSAGQPLVTLESMAQVSYALGTRKASAKHPRPTGPLLLTSRMNPGVGGELAALSEDPRPAAREGDVGRGALPVKQGRFTGIEIEGANAVLHYTVGKTEVRERFGSQSTGQTLRFSRHLEISAHAEPLYIVLDSAAGRSRWTVDRPGSAHASTPEGRVDVTTDSVGVTFTGHEGELVAQLAPQSHTEAVVISFTFPVTSTATPAINSQVLTADTQASRKPSTVRRWPESVTAPVQLELVSQNGLIFDRIAVPEVNPWKRRVRTADIAFLSDDRAAVVTYDGDIWLLSGLADPKLERIEWRRFASGLHEPLAIAAPGGVIQVATKNGVMRLHDRDRNGEADWFENFNDQMIQSQSTRSFPLDMAIAPDGSTYVAQGGIVTQSGLVSGGTGTAHTGALLKISADGRGMRMVADKAREPFVTVHPETGVVTGTDQQGHYIPTTPCYIIREGDSFGFLEEKPAKLTPPLVWIPHDQDISASSQVWMIGREMGDWHGRLLHLSYGSGRPLLIAPDLAAPRPQAAVIPLEFPTDLPLLHGRMHPRGDAVFLAGFQIWGTKTTSKWSLGRLRPGPTPITTAISALSCRNGVVLTFATPLDPTALPADSVRVRSWDYRRSSAYGSGRYARDGSVGNDRLGTGQLVLSRDRKSVFIHVPDLQPAMQVEVRHDFRLAAGAPARGAVYFTIHAPRDLDFGSVGFPPIDLAASVVIQASEKEPVASAAQGKALVQNLGCVVCHSTDGSTEGKAGPTWKGLVGAKRTLADGTTVRADEFYFRDKILDPQRNRVSAGPVEMPSYRGVISERQLDAIVLYLRSIK